jgi:hypothetical protein
MRQKKATMSGRKNRTRNWNFIIAMVITALATHFLWGCASTTRVDEALVAKYQPPATPNQDETMIYVIRTSSFRGAARTVWVACNDRYIAKLYSGSCYYFKVPAGINTVNIEQSGISIAYHQVDNRKGETVFLKLDYSAGKFVEIPKNQGITLVMKYKEGTKYSGNDKSDQYKKALLNPGFVGLELMKTSDSASSGHPSETSSVTFIRNLSLAKDVPFSLWSKEGWMGDLKGESYLSIKVQPGKHLFFCNAGNWSALELKAVAGKQYFVQVTVNRGWRAPDIKFIPIDSDTRNHDLQVWMKGSRKVTPNETAIDAAVRARLDAPMPIIEEAIKKVQDGSLVPVSFDKATAEE